MNRLRGIDPKWNWHFMVLMRLSAWILAARNAPIRAQGAAGDTSVQAHTHLMTKDPQGAVLFAELAMENDPFGEVECALGRIQGGTYGICEILGRAIPSDRLRSIPWTRFSREALSGAVRPIT